MRARALDASRPLPIYRGEEVKDILHESTAAPRVVANIPTGMEKGEEEEHHIQAALSTQQMSGTLEVPVMIPVPEANLVVPEADLADGAVFKMPKQYIRVNLFSFEEEKAEYDMDSEDEAWLSQLNQGAVESRVELTVEKFEMMMDRLDKAHLHGTFNENELGQLLCADDSLVAAVYAYYTTKLQRLGRETVTPMLRIGKTDDQATANDPYVAFRRRTERMQTRKNRKNDETAYMNMLKLLRDFDKARTILDMIRKREKRKKELLKLDMEIVDRRVAVEDWEGVHVQGTAHSVRPQPVLPPKPVAAERTPALHREEEKRKRMKRPKESAMDEDDGQYKDDRGLKKPRARLRSPDDADLSAAASSSSEDEGPTVVRRINALYHAPLVSPRLLQHRPAEFREALPLPVGPGQPYASALALPRPILRGFCRRRMGRGGRIFIDRIVPDRNPGAFGDSDGEADVIQLSQAAGYKSCVEALYARLSAAAAASSTSAPLTASTAGPAGAATPSLAAAPAPVSAAALKPEPERTAE